MLDIKFLRNNPDIVKQNIKNKSKNLENIKQSTTEKFKKPKAGSLKRLIQW